MSVTIGGPPAGARWHRRSIAVAAQVEPDSKRNVVRRWWEAQADARVVHVYQFGELWFVLVTDGRGRRIADATPGGLPDLATARLFANAVWIELRTAVA